MTDQVPPEGGDARVLDLSPQLEEQEGQHAAPHITITHPTQIQQKHFLLLIFMENKRKMSINLTSVRLVILNFIKM